MQMHPENSGHNGMWTPEETTSFNNKFYKVTLELEYFSTSSVTVLLIIQNKCRTWWIQPSATGTERSRKRSNGTPKGSPSCSMLMSLFSLTSRWLIDFFLEMLLDIFMMSRLLALWDVSQWQVDEDGRSSCDFSTCDPAPTATVVQAFAASNEVISLLCF